jgi:kynureninase
MGSVVEPNNLPTYAEHYRTIFHIPEGIYLLSHAVGPLPYDSKAAADKFFDEWGRLGCNAWDNWLLEIEYFQVALARLFNSPQENFSPQVNLSSALTKIFQSLPKREGRNRIILSLLDFPTIGFVAKQAERLGYEVVFANVPEGVGSHPHPGRGQGTVPSEIDPRTALIDEKTALVIWTHAYPNTGTAIEPPTRAELHGAYLCVDVAQSAGVIPVDVSSWDADFVIGSCVKFLCGGPGAGYLWVRPGLADELQPFDVGWFSHARPFEFDIESFEYAQGAARFWGGTPSVLPYAIASRSIHVILLSEVARIREHNLRLSQVLIDGALAKGHQLVSPQGPTQSGTVVLDTGDNWNFKQRLNAAGVHCDARKHGLRLSPHIYNTEEEIEVVVALL